VFTSTQVIGDTTTLPELQIAPSFVDEVVFNTVGGECPLGIIGTVAR
jgi:hypothetical protein